MLERGLRGSGYESLLCRGREGSLLRGVRVHSGNVGFFSLGVEAEGCAGSEARVGSVLDCGRVSGWVGGWD